MKTPEQKSADFKRIADKRVNGITDHFRVLGNLSSRSNYHYTDEEVVAIFKHLREQLDATEKMFAPPAAVKQFSLLAPPAVGA